VHEIQGVLDITQYHATLVEKQLAEGYANGEKAMGGDCYRVPILTLLLYPVPVGQA
jgi:hypothetical protein